jgi:TonB family protein
MNSKKQIKNIARTLFAMLFLAGTTSVFAQNTDYNKLEEMQDQNEIYLMEVYDVVKDYPHTTYEYVYHDGHLHKVLVDGIDDLKAKKKVETMIFKMRNNKDHMKNMCNRVGVYYVPDQEAEPKKGLDEFREKISENLTYPDEASSIGVEGTVFVKFIVDENGEIRNLTTAENIDSPYEQEVAMLEEAALEAVEEVDMDWTPAVSEGRLVESYVVVPVTFDFQKDPSIPVLIR